MLKLRFIGLLALLCLLVIVSGCSRPDDSGGEQTEQPTVSSSPSVSPSLEPTPIPSPTPEPTPLSPTVLISDQTLDEGGLLVAEQVSLPGPGWLVIYRTIDGRPDEIIGRQSLAEGVHDDVEIAVDTEAATELMLAGLHMDAGAEGVFDYPGEDEPWPGEPEAEFAVDLQLPQPQVEVAEQAVAENGAVMLTRVELLEPSWVMIHTDEDGEIGPVVGAVFLGPGIHENVPLTIDWRRSTPTLYAVLHEDDGRAGVVDYPDGDQPILKNGEPIVVAFDATYPPEVLVYDQPIIDGAITVERVISNGPGWVAIYNEIEGQPGFIIGSAPLGDGLNELMTVELLQPAISPRLFARLHQDTAPGDDFVPGQDPPVLFNNRLPAAAAFRTDSGAHALVRDQRLDDDGAVTLDMIVTPVPTWAAIYSDDEGQPGALLGRTWLPPGINRGVAVELDSTVEPGVLHLVLYQDLGETEQFEAPAVDQPLTNDDNRPIHIPFSLLPSAGS